VIAEACIYSESAFNLAEECGDLFSVFASDVVGDVVAGEQDYVGFELVDSFDAAVEVFGSDSSAEVKVAYVCDACSVQSVVKLR